MALMTEAPIEQKLKEGLSRLWWMPLVRGILLILFGVFMALQPRSTLFSLIWIMGFYWIVDGIFDIVEGIRGQTGKPRTWMIIGGIAAILAGIMIVGNPAAAGLIGGTFLTYLLGITIIANGIMLIFAGRGGHWTWWGLIMGILYVIFGLFVIAKPVVTIGTLVWLFSIWAVAAGILAVVLAFKLRGLAKS